METPLTNTKVVSLENQSTDLTDFYKTKCCKGKYFQTGYSFDLPGMEKILLEGYIFNHAVEVELVSLSIV